MNDEKQTGVATIIARLVANIFDNILISILTFFIVVILTFTSYDILHFGNFMEMLKIEPYSLDGPIRQPYELLQSMAFFMTSLAVLYGLLSLVYFQTLLMGEKRATFGMQLFKLKLISTNENELTFMRVLARNLLFIVLKTIYVGGLSIITMLATKRDQALHDLPVGTTIIMNK